MPNISSIREFMREKAKTDRNLRSVRAFGATLEEALLQASIELGVPIRKIEYEMVEKGSRGYLGIGKKDVVLVAYEISDSDGRADQDENYKLDLELLESEKIDKDGRALVLFSAGRILLKVTPPQGRGRKITESMVQELLRSRDVTDFDQAMVSEIIKLADSEYIRIGDFEHNSLNDAVMNVEITDEEMKAFLNITPPGLHGEDVSAKGIMASLRSYGIIHGIKEDVIADLEESPLFNQTILVAEGSPPIKGKNAKILYNFEKDHLAVHLEEKNGRVDFREMNLIQNVVEGQVLAKKVPADEGTPGQRVTGKLIPPKPGMDVDLQLGRNVRLSDDKLSVLAEINGQVVMTSDKLNVESVYMVPGDVNLKNGGNIIFLGTVFVKGSVTDGFKVKAAGNIEVMGNVGKSQLEAEGDVIIHKGINGKGEGVINAGKSVWTKFIENSRIKAGEMVVASDGIINSWVQANKRVICQGKRAFIVGGHVCAVEEIRAKTFGSPSGSETRLQVGYDPDSVARMVTLDKMIADFQDKLAKIESNIATLENYKKVHEEFPEEKAQFLEELIDSKKAINENKAKLMEEQAEITEYLASLSVVGKISAENRVHPGVKISIKDSSLKVRNEFKAATFITEEGLIKATKFEPPKEDYSRSQ